MVHPEALAAVLTSMLIRYGWACVHARWLYPGYIMYNVGCCCYYVYELEAVSLMNAVFNLIIIVLQIAEDFFDLKRGGSGDDGDDDDGDDNDEDCDGDDDDDEDCPNDDEDDEFPAASSSVSSMNTSFSPSVHSTPQVEEGRPVPIRRGPRVRQLSMIFEGDSDPVSPVQARVEDV